MFTGIDKIRRRADPASKAYDEAFVALSNTINETLVTNIR